MTRLTRRRGSAAVLVAALLTTGCGSATSTQTGPDEEPGSTTYTLYTHCGVESAHIDGRWWHAEPPLYNKERNGPPAGWGDPHQEGTLSMEAADRAVFEAVGNRVVFVPAPDDEPLRICR